MDSYGHASITEWTCLRKMLKAQLSSVLPRTCCQDALKPADRHTIRQHDQLVQLQCACVRDYIGTKPPSKFSEESEQDPLYPTEHSLLAHGYLFFAAAGGQDSIAGGGCGTNSALR